MNGLRDRVSVLARAAIAALALMIVLPAPALRAEDGNACSGCHETSNLECGALLSFVVDGCCGNWVDGSSSCVAGYGYAVACETGRQCMCNSQGQDCDVVRVAG